MKNPYKPVSRVFVLLRTPSILIRDTGPIKMNTTFLEGRLGLIHKRPSYRPTGRHPSPRSVSVWGSANKLISFSSTRTPNLCTHWLLMGNTELPHWVATRGSRWLVHRPPCNPTAIAKGSTQWVVQPRWVKPELVSLVTTKITALLAIPELDLVRQANMMTATHVETMVEVTTSKRWDTYWCNKKELRKTLKETVQFIHLS